MHDWRKILGALLAVVLAAGVTIAVVDNGPDHEPGKPRRSVTITLGGPQPGVQKVVVSKTALQAAKPGEADEQLRDESPPVLPAAQLQSRDQQLAKFRTADHLPSHFPASAPQQRGCVTRLVRNYSSRHGVRPRVFVLHYTVSANRPGWSDVDAIVGLFNNAGVSASSNYVVDAEGHCAYIVREVDKAWTQAAANPFSISVEVVNTGGERTYAGSAGLAKLGTIISDSTKRWNIPLRRGLVSGCRVVRSGVVDHHSLGACGGGHFDISPPFSVDAVLQAAKKARAPKTTKSQRWAQRHVAVHRSLSTSCRTKRQSAGRTCRTLRTRNRAYHRLLHLK